MTPQTPEARELQVEERDHEEPKEKPRQAPQIPTRSSDLGTKEGLRPLEEKQEGQSSATKVESRRTRHLLNPGFSQGSKYSKSLPNHVHFLPHQVLVPVSVQGGHGPAHTRRKSCSRVTTHRSCGNRWADSAEMEHGHTERRTRVDRWAEADVRVGEKDEQEQEQTVTHCCCKPETLLALILRNGHLAKMFSNIRIQHTVLVYFPQENLSFNDKILCKVKDYLDPFREIARSELVVSPEPLQRSA